VIQPTHAIFLQFFQVYESVFNNLKVIVGSIRHTFAVTESIFIIRIKQCSIIVIIHYTSHGGVVVISQITISGEFSLTNHIIFSF